MNNFDSELNLIIDNAEKAKSVKRSRPKKKSKSYKPLKFEHTDQDHPIKDVLIDTINSRDLTYDDLKKFSIEAFGDEVRGSRFMYNTIHSLSTPGGMRDETIMLLSDFLNLQLLFVPKDQDPITYNLNQLIKYLRRDENGLDKLNDIIDELESRVNNIDDITDDGE